MEQSGIANRQVDLVAVTYGPGLLGSLLTGMTFAKTFCMFYEKPLIGVNHLVGHLYAPLLSGEEIEYPNISLIVSGGHTDLLHVESSQSVKLLGATRDDAAGEVLDKIGRLLGLGFPAGSRLDKLAREGNPNAIELPRPMIDSEDFDFSFSGLKTRAVLYLKSVQETGFDKADLAASLESAVVDVLMAKLRKAVRFTDVRSVNVAGGVSANSLLRSELREWCRDENLKLTIPPLNYCMDNGAMIAVAGYHSFKEGKSDDISLDCTAVIEWV
jgi:N6-L-threonylcarbamoyladenine synthase